MEYFKLKYSTNYDIVGKCFPQSQECENSISINDPLYLCNNEIPLSEHIYIPNLLMENNAKFTDLISSSVIKYPIISEKIHEIITNFNHNLVNFHKTKVKKKSFEKDVFMISNKTKGFELIDISNAEIHLLEKFKFSKILNFSNFEDLEYATKTVQYPNTIAIMKYSISKNYNQDILYVENIHPEGGAYFFTYRLKEAIKNAGCTGIEFEPIEFG